MAHQFLACRRGNGLCDRGGSGTGLEFRRSSVRAWARRPLALRADGARLRRGRVLIAQDEMRSLLFMNLARAGDFSLTAEFSKMLEPDGVVAG